MLNSTIALNTPGLVMPEASVNVTPVNTVKDHAVRQHLLFIVENDDLKDEFTRENFHIFFASVEDACHLLDTSDQGVAYRPNVILVSSSLENYTDKYLIQLKEYAYYNAVPFLLYSPNFDKVARSIGSQFGFDDYYTGNLSANFEKKIEFIKKLKEYKNKRGNKPYQFNHHHAPSRHIKMWGLKRAFDIVVSGTLLLLLSPALLLIALIIRLESKGPIFYISKRAGNGYKIFDFYKFRSMRQGADSELKKLAHMNQYGDAVFFKIQNDPRITRFGAFIRNTSLDELPQLINVLKGDMSLVGNRPLPLYEAEKLTKDQIAWRFLAPAGITGLWQVTKRGKSEMSEDERIQLDMEYAMKNSFVYDIKILLSTIPALLQKVEA